MFLGEFVPGRGQALAVTTPGRVKLDEPGFVTEKLACFTVDDQLVEIGACELDGSGFHDFEGVGRKSYE